MSYYAKEYTCGSCKYYTYEGENTKGHCSYYGSYYYPDDSCRHYEKGDVSSSGGGCFLTQACCAFRGLPDDCEELTKMRAFRDNVMKKSKHGQKLVAFYYDNAPRIVHQIETSGQAKEIYEWLYENILEILELIENDQAETAMTEYLLLMYQCDLRTLKAGE